jgi:hypothetical protein
MSMNIAACMAEGYSNFIGNVSFQVVSSSSFDFKHLPISKPHRMKCSRVMSRDQGSQNPFETVLSQKKLFVFF